MNPTKKRLLLAAILVVPALAAAQSADDIRERLAESAEVVRELLHAPDGDIPEDLLGNAECVGVIPEAKKVALGFGGQYGRGAVVCRTHEGGPWGGPSMVALDGGSFGFQIGGSEMDLVLFFMTPDSVDQLIRGQVALGGELSVAGGPKGRTAEAATNLEFEAEILTYSRSRGLFAGVSLEGASLRPDHDANEVLYGRDVEPRSILVDRTLPVPRAATELIRALQSAGS